MSTRPAIACLLVAVFSGAAASVASAADPKLGKFVAYDAGKFQIVTSHGEAQVRNMLDDLALFQKALEAALRKKAAETGIPTLLYIVKRREWEKYLQPRAGIDGLFQSKRFANFILIDGEADQGKSLRVIFHEYTHFFLRSQFSGEYPPWFNEGLAEMFSEATFENGDALFGIPIDRVYALRQSTWMPFDRLLAVDQYSPEYTTHTLMPGFYGQAWLTVHYGMLGDREFGKQMYAYVNALNRLVPQDEAAPAAFGDLAAIDKKLYEYSRQDTMVTGGIHIGDAPPLTLSAGRPLSDTEALATIAELMLELKIAPDRIRPFVNAVSAREPNAPRGLVLRAQLANFDEDDARFERALDGIVPLLAPEDWQTRKALAHKPDDVEALRGYGTAARYLERDLDLAETRLKAAYVLAPANADIAVSLAQIYSAKRQPELMIPLLKDAIRFATQHQTREWAMETLLKVGAYLETRAAAELKRKKVEEGNEAAFKAWEKKVAKTRKKQRK